MAYSKKLIDHYENPRNVGSMDKESKEVGTGLVTDPARVGPGESREGAQLILRPRMQKGRWNVIIIVKSGLFGYKLDAHVAEYQQLQMVALLLTQLAAAAARRRG